MTNEKARPRIIASFIKNAKGKNTITVTNANFKAIQKFVLGSVEHLPKYIKRRLVLGYIAIFNKKLPEQNEKFANIWLRETVKPIKRIIENCPFPDRRALKDDQLIEHYARQNAAIALNMVELSGLDDCEYHENLFAAYEAVKGLCREWRVSMPYHRQYYSEKTEHDERIRMAESALLRCSAEKWWTGVLMRIKSQTNEHLLIAIGDVQKKRSPYISAQSLSEWRNQQRANRDYLEMMEVVQMLTNAETGEEFESITTLKEIADASSSNPKHRFTELMLRCRGLENIAIDDGLEGLFLTITTPSQYHAISKGQINPKWNGGTPKEAQKYLVAQWAKIRAMLKRCEINYFGVRVTEPHHDGTPHWHLLLFVVPSQADELIKICRSYALEVDGDEKGAEKHRFTVERIDPSKGSATGYIAKYLSKNINGEYIDNVPNEKSGKGSDRSDNTTTDFESGRGASEGSQRATAWASRWTLRQFQFFGAEPVTIYREARRLKSPVAIESIELIRQAVETDDPKGKWYAFTKAMQKNPIDLKYQVSTNDYNEETKAIKGLIARDGEIKTRNDDVVLRKRGSVLPWSPVTNCTASNNGASELAEMQKIGLDEFMLDRLKAGSTVVNGFGEKFRIENNQLLECRH